MSSFRNSIASSFWTGRGPPGLPLRGDPPPEGGEETWERPCVSSGDFFTLAGSVAVVVMFVFLRHSREGGNPVSFDERPWVPACAGTTARACARLARIMQPTR